MPVEFAKRSGHRGLLSPCPFYLVPCSFCLSSFTFFLLAFAFLSSACGSARPSKFYSLEVPASVAAPADNTAPFPVSLLVGRIRAPHIYRDDRIVYRSSGLQLGTYEYHRWAEPPTDMLEAMLVRTLRASGRYRSVQSLSSNTRGDYIVRGRLFDFEEISSPSVVARVAFEIELFDQQSGTVVWTQFYSSDEPVEGKEVPQVVEALDRNVRRGFNQITAGIEQYFAKNPPKPSK
jgi:ABC-type uncharacterized transport system auxiliary subunit